MFGAEVDCSVFSCEPATAYFRPPQEAMKLVALAILAICITGALAGTYTNAQAVQKLSAAGISVRSSGGCSDRNNGRYGFDVYSSFIIHCYFGYACDLPL
jgi:hypothetical protein